MTEEETRGAGTTEGGSGDAGEQTQTTVTPPEAGRTPEWTPGVTRDEFLAMKAKAEEANALKAQLEEMQRTEQPPGAQSQDPPVDWGAVRFHADRGDPVAKAQLVVAQAMLAKDQEDRRRQALEDQLDEIDDAAQRAEVRKRLKASKGEADVRTVRAELDREHLAAQNKALADKLAAYEQMSDRPGGMKPPSIPREVPAQEHKTRSMRVQDFEREVARKRREDGELAALLFRNQVNEGKIDLVE